MAAISPSGIYVAAIKKKVTLRYAEIPRTAYSDNFFVRNLAKTLC